MIIKKFSKKIHRIQATKKSLKSLQVHKFISLQVDSDVCFRLLLRCLNLRTLELVNHSTFVFLNNHTSIMSAKAESIAQCGIYGSLLCFIESKIQFWIQVRIIGKMINSRRNNIMNNRFDTGDGFYYPAW